MDIEEYLSAQRESGRVDSEGIFTVALEKARQKLGQFQLEDPSFYLLKVVQAAVQAGTSRIDLRQTRGKLALWFDSFSSLGGLGALLAALHNPLEAEPGPGRSLAIAFNSAVFSSPLQVSLAWWGPDESGALLAVGEEVSSTSAPSRPSGFSDRPYLHVFSVSKAKPGWFQSATGPEHDALVEACSYCSVPIGIDGRRLPARRLPSPLLSPWPVLTEPFNLVERLEPISDGPLRFEVPGAYMRRRGRNGWLRISRSTAPFSVQPLEPLSAVGAAMSCANGYALPVGLSGADRIHLVRHGVKVDTILVNPDGAGACAVMSADHLEYDLSGFGAIRNAEYDELVAKANAVWRDMARSMPPDLDQLTSSPTEEQQKESAARRDQSCGCSMLGCVGAYFLLLSLPTWLGGDASLAVLMASMVGGGAAPFFKRRPSPQVGLRELVAQRLEQLRGSWPEGNVGVDESSGLPC